MMYAACLQLHAPCVSISKAFIAKNPDEKQVSEFSLLLVDVEALLSLMRQLLITAESPETIVAPATLEESPLNALTVKT
jgi:hypothetical protein